MNTKAIYTVHENGKEHYFFSEHAGGFSYPFAVADFLHSLKGVLNDQMSPQKGLCAAPMLKQMKGNYHSNNPMPACFSFVIVQLLIEHLHRSTRVTRAVH